MASTTNVTQRANKLKWKWGGHIARMKDERWTYRATMWDPRTGDRHRGRPRKRWADFYTTQADAFQQTKNNPGLLELIRKSSRRRLLRVEFKVCHGSLYAVMWLAGEPREFNLPTLPQRHSTYMPEKLPGKYGVHSEREGKEFWTESDGDNSNIARMEQVILEKSCMTFSAMEEATGFTRNTLQRIVHDHLKMGKMSASKDMSRDLLRRHDQDPAEFKSMRNDHRDCKNGDPGTNTSPYSPDLDPIDYHLFRTLRNLCADVILQPFRNWKQLSWLSEKVVAEVSEEVGAPVAVQNVHHQNSSTGVSVSARSPCVLKETGIILKASNFDQLYIQHDGGRPELIFTSDLR
ncbi:hypothetical protein ANN_18152 [Periplaneta americana]|uniref:Uncharacterized protein n=1 Tax=Periplaneta americana TaxID=6978 RepID=A0ABQ8SMY4_PERAM|nr:hypothetical protein ANN_18152 [Periplaneta americana]